MRLGIVALLAGYEVLGDTRILLVAESRPRTVHQLLKVGFLGGGLRSCPSIPARPPFVHDGSLGGFSVAKARAAGVQALLSRLINLGEATSPDEVLRIGALSLTRLTIPTEYTLETAPKALTFEGEIVCRRISA